MGSTSAAELGKAARDADPINGAIARRLRLGTDRRNELRPSSFKIKSTCQMRYMMKRITLLLLSPAVLIAGILATANAQDIRVGPGGVRVAPPERNYYNQYRDADRDEARNCRVIITHRTNRFGEPVTVRRRICD